eukprot:1563660-Amphidinium_carterae.1
MDKALVFGTKDCGFKSQAAPTWDKILLRRSRDWKVQCCDLGLRRSTDWKVLFCDLELRRSTDWKVESPLSSLESTLTGARPELTGARSELTGHQSTEHKQRKEKFFAKFFPGP